MGDGIIFLWSACLNKGQIRLNETTHTHTQLWACVSHKVRPLIHPDVSVPMHQDCPCRAVPQTSAAVWSSSGTLNIRSQLLRWVNGDEPQAAARTNCCDPAVSHDNHERPRRRFIRQKASDVGFHSTACSSRPQMSDWQISASGASVMCVAKILTGTLKAKSVFRLFLCSGTSKWTDKLTVTAWNITPPVYWPCPLSFPSSHRVINAGKSALNEDQACCTVVVARRRPMSYCPPSTPSKTPTAKRRNSLPNGEGLGLQVDNKLEDVSKHWTS